MRAPRSWLGLLGTLALAGMPAPAGAQPVGSEFQINTYTTSNQRTIYQGHLIAADASGNFVVAWQSNTQDGSSYGIFGQRYDSGGIALGGQFRVNSLEGGAPSVASDTSGNFVVARQSDDGSSVGIFGQRYDSAGVAQGDEFRVNSYTTSYQRFPSVASDASGNFVVVWEGKGQGDGFGIFGQRYDGSGDAQGDEFRVNSYTTDVQWRPSVAAAADGDFVVVWESQYQDGSSFGVFGQRYDSAGVAQGDEFQINSFATGSQLFASVGATGTNQFVVAWDSADGSLSGVFGQRFNFASVTVQSPNTNVRWRIGSHQRIKWTHKLGLSATFRIELDRDDDGDYEELIAAAAPASSATRGSFAWTVTGPTSATARVRVSWTDDPAVSDASDVPFQIKPGPVDAGRGAAVDWDSGSVR